MQRLLLGNTDISNMLKLDDKYVQVPFEQIPFSASLLVVGGGGGGGQSYTFLSDGSPPQLYPAGGGGAGGMVYGEFLTTIRNSFTVQVGGGGTPGEYGDTQPTSGSNSSFIGSGSFEVTAFGGGRGGQFTGAPTTENGGVGGSGGGAGGGPGSTGTPGAATSGSFPSGTSFFAYGNAGGSPVACFPNLRSNSGGGGAGSAGSSNDCDPVQGNGKIWPEDALYYAEGGGANAGPILNSGYGGNPGSIVDNTVPVIPVTTIIPAKAGSSGVVVIKYKSAANGGPKAIGGTITQSGGYTYHTFTESGTFFVYKTI
jgi:hypothetical protein